MTAVDTDVVVRILAGDDPKQTLSAKTLFASGPIWIAKTVLLEAAWVLRSAYGFKDTAVRTALEKLLGLRNVTTEDAPAVAAALKLTADGLDFADALQLRSKPPGARFATVDKDLIQRAKRAGETGVFSVP